MTENTPARGSRRTTRKKPNKVKRSQTSSDLTPKQAAFAAAFVASGNAARAYRIAYDADAMKPETVHREAHRLMHNTKIATRIQLLQAELSERSRHNLDTLLREAHLVYQRALGKRAFKVATDAIALKMRLLGLDRSAVSPNIVNVRSSISATPIDWNRMSLADLYAIDTMIREATERAAAGQ